MNEKQALEVIDALVNFIIRVSKGETTSETEVQILPEVVNALSNI